MTDTGVPAGVIAEAVAAAREMLRVTGAQEDAVLTRLAATAFALAEAFCGEVLVARGFAETVEAAAGWTRLARWPVTAIVAGAGPDSENSAIDIDADGNGWVQAATRVTVTYTAGRAAAFGDLPPGIAHGIVLLTAHLFDNRQSEVAPPAAVAALWRPYRRLTLARAVHPASVRA